MKYHIKLTIFIAVELIAVLVIVLLIMFAGRKTYTVTFDLNEGILLSGDLEQTVRIGQSATPPNVTKDGCYLRGWSVSYQKVTKDIVTKAVWEYETTYGIEYNVTENSNYCTISGCYEELSGDVYIGAYYKDKNGRELKVLGIEPGAFKDCTLITGMYLLDGIIAIGDEAFKGCTNMKIIDIPSTVEKIGNNAFEGCESLVEVEVPQSLRVMGDYTFLDCILLENVIINDGAKCLGNYAFMNCEALKEIYIPKTVELMGKDVFNTPEMIINCEAVEDDIIFLWDVVWCLEDATITYGYVKEPENLEGVKKEVK